MRNPKSKYLAALFFVLALASGVGIGYVWASGRAIQVFVVCHFPMLRT